MIRILIPVLDSLNALPAARLVVRDSLHGERPEVHLLHVRTPLAIEFARLVAGSSEPPSHPEVAAEAMGPVLGLLETFHVPWVVHLEVGDKAPLIVAAAFRLHVDRVVLGAARRGSLARWVEDRVIDKVIDFAPVPVDLVSGRSAWAFERFALPAGVGAAFGLLWLPLD